MSLESAHSPGHAAPSGGGLRGRDPATGLPYVDYSRLDDLPEPIRAMFLAPSQPGLAAVLWFGRCAAVGARHFPPRAGFLVVGTAAAYVCAEDGAVLRHLPVSALRGVVYDDEGWVGLRMADGLEDGGADELFKVVGGPQEVHSLEKVLGALYGRECIGAMDVRRVRAASVNIRTLLRLQRRRRSDAQRVLPLRVVGTAPPAEQCAPPCAALSAPRLSAAHLSLSLPTGARLPPIVDEGGDAGAEGEPAGADSEGGTQWATPFDTPNPTPRPDGAGASAPPPVTVQPPPRGTPLQTPADEALAPPGADAGRLRPQGQAALASADRPEPPPVLVVSSAEKPEAAGTFLLVGQHGWRGLPLWAATDDRRIYAEAEGHWVVGTDEVMQHNAGWLMTAESSDRGRLMPPDAALGGWKAYDHVAAEWVGAPGTTVAEAVPSGSGAAEPALARALAEQEELERRLQLLRATAEGGDTDPQLLAELLEAETAASARQEELDRAHKELAEVMDLRRAAVAALGLPPEDAEAVDEDGVPLPLAPAAESLAAELAAAVAAAQRGDDAEGDIATLSARLGDTAARRAAVRAECDTLAARLAAAKGVREDSEAQQREIEAELAALVQQVTDFSRDREQLLLEVARARAANRSELEQQQQDYDRQVADLSAQLRIMEGRLLEGEQALELTRAAQRRVEEAAQLAARNCAALEQLRGELAELQRSEQELRGRRDALLSAQSDAASHSPGGGVSPVRSASSTAAEEGVRDACEQLAAAVARIDELTPAAEEAQQLRWRVSQYDSQIEALDGQVRSIIERMRNLQRGYEHRLSERNTRLSDCDAEIRALQAALDSQRRLQAESRRPSSSAVPPPPDGGSMPPEPAGGGPGTPSAGTVTPAAAVVRRLSARSSEVPLRAGQPEPQGSAANITDADDAATLLEQLTDARLEADERIQCIDEELLSAQHRMLSEDEAADGRSSEAAVSRRESRIRERELIAEREQLAADCARMRQEELALAARLEEEEALAEAEDPAEAAAEP